MGTYTISAAHHGTTVGTVIDTINFNGAPTDFRIMNSGATDLYFTVPTGAGVGAADPVAGAEESLLLPAATTQDIHCEFDISQIKVLSTLACAYHVELPVK